MRRALSSGLTASVVRVFNNALQTSTRRLVGRPPWMIKAVQRQEARMTTAVTKQAKKQGTACLGPGTGQGKQHTSRFVSMPGSDNVPYQNLWHQSKRNEGRTSRSFCLTSLGAAWPGCLQTANHRCQSSSLRSCFVAACLNKLTDHQTPPALQAGGGGISIRTGTSASSAPPGPSRTSGAWAHRRACRPAPRRPWRGPMSAYVRLTCCRLTQVRRCAVPAALHRVLGA